MFSGHLCAVVRSERDYFTLATTVLCEAIVATASFFDPEFANIEQQSTDLHSCWRVAERLWSTQLTKLKNNSFSRGCGWSQGGKDHDRVIRPLSYWEAQSGNDQLEIYFSSLLTVNRLLTSHSTQNGTLLSSWNGRQGRCIVSVRTAFRQVKQVKKNMGLVLMCS